MSERLQKIMAKAGLGSRRQNEALIKAGRVKVNGKVAKLGDSAEIGKDKIEVDGTIIKAEKLIYIMLNKPKGVLSSTEDELGEGRQTVRDMVNLPGHIYPVGRLDLNSQGLMLLTNDGNLAHVLTHPRYGHEKTYHVWVERKPSNDTLRKWRKGVLLEDKMTMPCYVEILEKDSYVVKLKIVMREGRKRQIRRVAALLGHNVRKLERDKIGPLKLGKLETGKWRHLTQREVRMLKQAAKLSKQRMPRDRRQRPSQRRGDGPPKRRRRN